MLRLAELACRLVPTDTGLSTNAAFASGSAITPRGPRYSGIALAGVPASFETGSRSFWLGLFGRLGNLPGISVYRGDRIVSPSTADVEPALKRTVRIATTLRRSICPNVPQVEC